MRIRINKQTILKIYLTVTILFTVFFSTRSYLSAACPNGCIDSGSPCGSAGTYPYCLNDHWSQCLDQCVTPCSCMGGQGWCTCSTPTCTGCGCTPPSCPAGYTETNTGCGTTTTSCTNLDSCGNSCGGTTTRTCYQNTVYTGAPSAPTAIYMRVNTTVYSLSTNSGSPTQIPFPAGATVTTYAPSAPSNGGYWYNAYNAYSGGSLTLSYEGTTQSQTLSYSNQGRVAGEYYAYRCPSYTGTKYYSSAVTGYYCNNNCSTPGACTPSCPSGQTTTVTGPDCSTGVASSCTYSNSCGSSCSGNPGATCYYLETNSAGPSAPTSVQMTVGTSTYTLSTDPANPTKIKLPRGDTVQLIVPTISGADGYRFVADNYGVSNVWSGGTECSGVNGEDFCTQGTSRTTNFAPSTKTVAQVLTEGAKGKITGYGYTDNDCDSNVKYSTATVGYYEVKVLPASNYYQIQVNTDAAFTGDTMWDSGKTSMTATKDGERTPNLVYAGTSLIPGVKYYWRIKLWDDTDNESEWSQVAEFRMSGGPYAPIGLRTNGSIDPTTLTDPTPRFTAIHSDPNGDSAIYYEVEVNTSSTFTGTTVWDSDKRPMNTTAHNTRCPDIIYSGSPLSSTGDTYYWRIRFWDTDDLVGEWSATATFQATFQQFRFNGLKLEGIKLN